MTLKTRVLGTAVTSYKRGVQLVSQQYAVKRSSAPRFTLQDRRLPPRLN